MQEGTKRRENARNRHGHPRIQQRATGIAEIARHPTPAGQRRPSSHVADICFCIGGYRPGHWPTFPVNTRLMMLFVRAQKLCRFPVDVLLVINRSLEFGASDDQEMPLEVIPANPVTVFWLMVTSWNGSESPSLFQTKIPIMFSAAAIGLAVLFSTRTCCADRTMIPVEPATHGATRFSETVTNWEPSPISMLVSRTHCKTLLVMVMWFVGWPFLLPVTKMPLAT